MSDETEARAKQVFQDALDREAHGRAAFIESACEGDVDLQRRVDQLLAAHARLDKFLEDPPSGEDADDLTGRMIDDYRIVERIGKGGFGEVYRAEQQRPVRMVALKVVRWGLGSKDVLARFAAERQALARMEHPGIAMVFDAGRTPQGRPYFVMELVRGVPITDYCDAEGLDTAARLGLIRSVCAAVEHAHQKGVIHRDIKPSNLLVVDQDGRPLPKVIDFGIAKATEGRLTEQTLSTGLHQMIGTPEYMAPEQAETLPGDVDTRADVFALGVLTYELLTGTKPFDMHALLETGYEALLRHIREVDPPRPSNRVSTMDEQEALAVAA